MTDYLQRHLQKEYFSITLNEDDGDKAHHQICNLISQKDYNYEEHRILFNKVLANNYSNVSLRRDYFLKTSFLVCVL